ncbi:MAG: hypothetical protein AAFV93_17565 [Chloroflexota bacterium]
MNENIQVTIRGLVIYKGSQDSHLEERFKKILDDPNIEINFNNSAVVGKSHIPVELQFVIDAIEALDNLSFLEGYLVGKALDTSIKRVHTLFKGLSQKWNQQTFSISPYKPVKISINIGNQFSVDSYPYIVEADWKINLFANLAKVTQLVDEHDLMNVSKITIVSVSINDTRALVYCNSSKPEFVIDISSQSIDKISNNDIKSYEELGIEFADPEYDAKILEALPMLSSGFIKRNLHEAKLYDELISKLREERNS